jgi:hypothetical protein
MPKRKRRQWVGFVKKVNAVNLKSLGTNTVIFNKSVSATPTPLQQGLMACALYGKAGTTHGTEQSGFDDVYRICLNDNRVTTAGDYAKVQFGSGVIDLTMRNTSVSVSLEVDLYEMVFRTDDSSTGNVLSTYSNAAIQAGTIPGSTGTSLSLANRGATPFDLPIAISADKVKILKKKKYFIPPGNAVTFQHRDSGNHYFNVVDILQTDFNDYSWKYVTRVFLVVAKTLAGEANNGAISVAMTRKYTYTVDAYGGAKDAYFG